MKFHPTLSARIESLAADMRSRNIDPTPVAVCDVLWQSGPSVPPSAILAYLQKWHRELYSTDAAHMGKRWRESKLCPRER